MSLINVLVVDQDGAEPSGNSVSAMNLLRLADYIDMPEWRDRATQLLIAFSKRLIKIPIALPEMLSALLYLHNTPKQVRTLKHNINSLFGGIMVENQLIHQFATIAVPPAGKVWN